MSPDGITVFFGRERTAVFDRFDTEGKAMERALTAAFFAQRPQALPLYETLEAELLALGEDVQAVVQRTQITFRNRCVFAAVSFARCPKREPHSVMLTFGLPARLDSPRVFQAVEPYPGRWTHHVLLCSAEQIDAELLGWLRQAYAFARIK